MHKPVAFINEDALIGDHLQIIEELQKTAKQQADFVQKQMDNIRKQYHDAVIPIFEKITAYLKSIGKLPTDFDGKDHHYHIDTESSLLHICDRDNHGEHPLEKLLREMGGVIVPVRGPK